MAGATPSPNIWRTPDVYEVENRAVDPDGILEAEMRGIRDWAGGTVVDIGCGTGYHLPWFAADAARVIGVEPHRANAQRARHRVAGLSNVSVLDGLAQNMAIPDSSVDVAHARWSYFFGPGCEPGLAEVERITRRYGVFFVIDNDATRSTFGGWFRQFLPKYDVDGIERFWISLGFHRKRLDIRWSFKNRADFESVVRIEFSEAVADHVCATHEGLEVDYAVNLWWREF